MRFIMAMLLGLSTLAMAVEEAAPDEEYVDPASQAIQISWTSSTSDTDGNILPAEIILYHIWIWLDGEGEYIDYIQTQNTSVIVDLTEDEFKRGMCYPLYVTAERTDAGLQSDPSPSVTICYTSQGVPYDGENPPVESSPEIINQGKPIAPEISIYKIRLD